MRSYKFVHKDGKEALLVAYIPAANDMAAFRVWCAREDVQALDFSDTAELTITSMEISEMSLKSFQVLRMEDGRSVKDVRRIMRHVELQQQELDILILLTPSGEARNALTEANIHLLEVKEILANIC